MNRRSPTSTRTYTLVPDTALFLSLCGRRLGAFEGAAGPGIEGDEVHFGRNALQQTDETALVVLAVVHALQHDVLEGDTPGIVGAGIAAAGAQQHRQREIGRAHV